MKLTSLQVIRWYAATLGIAAGAVLYAYLDAAAALAGILTFSVASYASLTALRNTDEDHNPYRKLSEVLAAAGMVLFLPLILLADFLVALILFIGLAQLALNLQTYDYRRLYVGLGVSFMGICVGAAQSRSGFYLFFLLAYTVAAGITIGCACLAQRSNVQNPHWNWVGRTRVFLLMIGLAVVVYLVVPRFPAGGFLSQPGSDHFYRDKQWEEEAKKNGEVQPSERRDDAGDASRRFQGDHSPSGTANGSSPRGPAAPEKSTAGGFDYRGFKNEFDIDAPDPECHRFSDRIVARMRSDHPHYLRVRIFDRFDGFRWASSSDRLVKLMVGYDGVDLVPAQRSASSTLRSYEIFIEHDLGDYIPAAAVPVHLKFPGTVVGIDAFGQLHAPAPLKKGTAYAVVSQSNFMQGRLFAELDDHPLPAYTQLPPDTDPRIRELAADVARGTSTQLEAAVALEQFLRTQYEYDFDSVFDSQGHTPLDEFLFETRSGHCEYFASALAVMLRTQQIPSRLVTGFSATNRNPLTGYYDIYALDGHAWVEAYVDGRGWVILEPTAYYEGPVPEEKTLSVQQINDYVESQIRRRHTLGREDLTLEELLHAGWHLLYVLASAGLAYVKWFIVTNRYGLMCLLAAAMACAWAWRRFKDQWRAHRLHRKVMAYTPDPPEKAIAFYLTAIDDLLGHAGWIHPPGHTIEHYLQQLRSIGAGPADNRLSRAFNRVHYNAEPVDHQTADDYKQLFRDLYAMGFQNLQSALKTVRETPL